MNKRCFVFTKCEYEHKCEHAHVPPENGYFQSEHTGQFCHHFKPLVMQPEEMFKYQGAIE